MNQEIIFLPVLAQITLTIIVYFVLAGRKAAAVKAGADRSKTALNNKAWPESVLKASNNIDNQFEIPVLFYVLCLLTFSLNAVDAFSLGLASAFAISRYAHAYIHLNSNFIPHRLKLFLLGCLCLIALTIKSFLVILM